MRAARREDLLALGMADRRSGYPLEMFLKASLRNWRIVELPVPYAPRTGKSRSPAPYAERLPRSGTCLPSSVRPRRRAAGTGPG